MSARRYTLAHVDDTADVEFLTLRALAAHLAAWRAALPPGDDGEPQSFLLRGAQVHGRGAGLDGACIAVRVIHSMAQADDPGPGRLVGYAFLPEYPYVTAGALITLNAAINAEAAALAARAPAKVAA